MKKIVIFIVILVFVFSCNDGDFDIPSLDFSSQDINDCGDLVLFKINETEALFFELPNNNVLTEDTTTLELIDAINYRIFNDGVTATYFCNEIPPSTPIIQQEWSGSGTLNVTNIITRDDNDRVEEDSAIVDNPDTTINEADIDEDGFPNYYDDDDDGDGILTRNEVPLDENDEPIFTDTDGDNTPNYLDNDDDGDGVLTINESLANYLDSNVSVPLIVPNTTSINIHTLSYLATFTISNMSLINSSGNNIIFDTFDYGTKNGTIIIED